MIILKDKDNVVLFRGDNITYGVFDEPNLNKWEIIDGDGLFYVIHDSATKVEVDSIPSDYKPSKYCYAAEEGFYNNPNYLEPYSIDTEIERLSQENTELKAQLDNVQEVLDYLVMQ
ncbi:hypothetical protein [Anaerosporobacter sp.]